MTTKLRFIGQLPVKSRRGGFNRVVVTDEQLLQLKRKAGDGDWAIVREGCNRHIYARLCKYRCNPRYYDIEFQVRKVGEDNHTLYARWRVEEKRVASNQR